MRVAWALADTSVCAEERLHVEKALNSMQQPNKNRHVQKAPSALNPDFPNPPQTRSSPKAVNFNQHPEPRSDGGSQKSGFTHRKPRTTPNMPQDVSTKCRAEIQDGSPPSKPEGLKPASFSYESCKGRQTSSRKRRDSNTSHRNITKQTSKAQERLSPECQIPQSKLNPLEALSPEAPNP